MLVAPTAWYEQLTPQDTPSRQTEYTTFGAGFSSHTLEVFSLLSFFRTHTTRTVTSPRAEIIRASASYSALTACASMSIPPVHCMRRTAEAEREAVS